MAMHGYMSDGDPLCHSVALSLTLSLKLSWSTVLPWSFSSFSLSVPNFFQCLHICVWEDICIPSILLRHFCHWISGNVKPTPSGSHWQPIVCTHWLSKASVISFFSQNLTVFRMSQYRRPLCCSQRTWFTVYNEKRRVRKWWEREWQKNSLGGF